MKAWRNPLSTISAQWPAASSALAEAASAGSSGSGCVVSSPIARLYPRPPTAGRHSRSGRAPSVSAAHALRPLLRKSGHAGSQVARDRAGPGEGLPRSRRGAASRRRARLAGASTSRGRDGLGGRSAWARPGQAAIDRSAARRVSLRWTMRKRRSGRRGFMANVGRGSATRSKCVDIQAKPGSWGGAVASSPTGWG